MVEILGNLFKTSVSVKNTSKKIMRGLALAVAVAKIKQFLRRSEERKSVGQIEGQQCEIPLGLRNLIELLYKRRLGVKQGRRWTGHVRCEVNIDLASNERVCPALNNVKCQQPRQIFGCRGRESWNKILWFQIALKEDVRKSLVSPHSSYFCIAFVGKTSVS